jgi:septal ring factor EnvC (AmiA/AmiB activator)
MNSRLVAIILVLICLGLAGGLFYRHSEAVKEKKQDTQIIQDLTNQVTDVKMKLEEQKLVNVSLERDFTAQGEQLKVYSNNLATVSSNFTKVQADAKAAAESAKAEMIKRDARIAELESERDGLSKRMTELNSSISSLETKISDTQKKLDASEGDRDFLLKELKRLQTEKAELEKQFNDLALLREQVRRLRDEMSISRRLDWIRRGLYGPLVKGGELLQKGIKPPTPQTNYNLNVELNRDGSVKVIPPSTNASNATGSTNNAPAPR